MPPTNAYSPQPNVPTSGRLAALSTDPAPLFVYGSLLFDDVVRILINRDPHRTPATVHGWRAAALPGRVYPALIAEPEATASGHLLDDLTVEEWQTLDTFEADFYTLARITFANGKNAWTYAAEDPATVEPVTWDPEIFARQHLSAYLTNCTAWRQHYDASR